MSETTIGSPHFGWLRTIISKENINGVTNDGDGAETDKIFNNKTIQAVKHFPG